MNKVYIAGGLRSHIGIKNGIFRKVLPEKLGAHVLKKLIDKYYAYDFKQQYSDFTSIVLKAITERFGIE